MPNRVKLRLKRAILGATGLLGAFFLLFGLVARTEAQVQLIPLIKAQYFDQNGRPLAGGCIFSYQSGTTTPQNTYTDSTGGTPNTNPIVLNGAGRPVLDVWLTGTTAYRIKLVSAGGTNCASGTTQWQEDGINPSPASLLASNNVWTGSNTFNGAVTFNAQPTFNVGLTSSGPNVLAGGGTLSGTWSGSPIFSGTPNFSSGFLATTGTFSGQIISTVSTGTAPFVIASTTQVNNLNAALLNGCTWAVPCAIGTTTPNTAVFTTLSATTFALGGGTTQTGTQGTDTHLLTSGTVSGTGASLCTDANGGATTSGCASSFTKFQAASFCASGCTVTVTPCTTTSGAYDHCDTTLTWPVTFADAAYIVTCQGINLNDGSGTAATDGYGFVQSKAAASTVFRIVNVISEGSGVQYHEIDCQGVHN